MSKGRLVAFTGYAGSGKTTARIALNNAGWRHVKMADTLKNMARVMFSDLGLNPEDCVEGRLKEIQLDELLGKSPRHVMQTLGTEWGRGCIGDSIWVTIAKSRIEKLLCDGVDVVLDDVRFDNEAEMIASLGGTIVEINGRGGISGNHESENVVKSSLKIENNGKIEDFQNSVVYILHRINY